MKKVRGAVHIESLYVLGQLGIKEGNVMGTLHGHDKLMIKPLKSNFKIGKGIMGDWFIS